jgi:hypothetical protein
MPPVPTSSGPLKRPSAGWWTATKGVRYVFLDRTRGDGRARVEAHRPDVA